MSSLLRKVNVKSALTQVRGFSATSMANIKLGDKIPNVEVFGESPAQSIKVFDHFKKYDKALLFGFLGAFTSGCSKEHVPGVLKNLEKFKSKGIEEVAIVAVNDPFVLNAFAEQIGAKGKLTVLADYQCELTKASGLDFNLSVLGNDRSKRFAMLLENGVVKKLSVEPDNYSVTVSSADNFLKEL